MNFEDVQANIHVLIRGAAFLMGRETTVDGQVPAAGIIQVIADMRDLIAPEYRYLFDCELQTFREDLRDAVKRSEERREV